MAKLLSEQQCYDLCQQYRYFVVIRWARNIARHRSSLIIRYQIPLAIRYIGSSWYFLIRHHRVHWLVWPDNAHKTYQSAKKQVKQLENNL